MLFTAEDNLRILSDPTSKTGQPAGGQETDGDSRPVQTHTQHKCSPQTRIFSMIWSFPWSGSQQQLLSQSGNKGR